MKADLLMIYDCETEKALPKVHRSQCLCAGFRQGGIWVFQGSGFRLR